MDGVKSSMRANSPSEVAVTVRYQVLSANQIEITSVSSSRDWIATLANELLPVEQRQIEVPPAVVTALSKVIR